MRTWHWLMCVSLLLPVIPSCGAPAGSISVTSNPTGAEVYLDGSTTKEVTPCKFQGVAPGGHAIVCRAAGFCELLTVTVVAANRLSTVHVDLVPLPTKAVVRITSEPVGAHVWWNGVDTGRLTPTSIEDQPPGEYALKLVKNGWIDGEWSVTLRAGENSARFSLQTTPVYALAEDFDSMLCAVDAETGSKQVLFRMPEVSGDTDASMALSASGTRIAVGSQDEVLILTCAGQMIDRVDLLKACPESPLPDHPARDSLVGRIHWHIVGLQWLPDNETLLMQLENWGGYYGDKMLTVRYEMPGHKLTIVEKVPAALSPDGKLIAYIKGSEIYVAGPGQANERTLSAKLDTRAIHTQSRGFRRPPHWSPDGMTVLCYKDGEGYILDLEGTVRQTIPRLIAPVACSPNGEKVFAFDGKYLCVYSTQSQQWRKLGSPFYQSFLAAGSVVVPKGDGSVTVTCSHTAKVSVDGTLTGRLTPTTLSLPAGPHRVKVWAIDGNFQKEKVVNVVPGTTAEVRFSERVDDR